MKHFKRKAFTLIEVMISIVLLYLIFSFLYSTINSIKQQNNPYIEKSKNLKIEQKIYKLINFDIISMVSAISVKSYKSYDLISFQTKNSLYGIVEPNVTYFVSKKEKALVRVESLKPIDFTSKKTESNKVFIYADIITKDCISFKVKQDKAFVTLLFRTKDLNPMLFTVPIIKK